MQLTDTQSLWPHQTAEIPHLLAGHRLLAWEPGTGKTRAVLTAFALRLPTLPPAERRALCVVPANVRTQWAAVACAAGFTVQVVAKTTEAVRGDTQIVVVSYEAISRVDVWKSAMRFRWGALILDEAHQCKTPSAKRTRAIFGAKPNTKACLIRQTDRVWLLTGTPIMKDPGDLWVFVSRLAPSIPKAEGITRRTDWVYRWCKGYETPYGFVVTGARDADKLHSLLKPFMSRAKKREVLPHLKEPIFERFRLPPRKVEIDSEADARIAAYLEALEGADTPPDNITADPQVSQLRRAIGLSKAGEIAEHIVTELTQTGEKALVFFLHTDVGNAIFDALAAAGLDPVLYSGKVSASAKERGKNHFLSVPSCRAFVGQIQASGTGLDGLQEVASRVFIAEEPWTPGQLDQIIGRVDRGGQTHQPYVTSYVVANSYDERVVKALGLRTRVVGAIIDGKTPERNDAAQDFAVEALS